MDITAAENRSQTTIDQKSQQTGLSISLSNPVVHAIETGINMAQAAKNTGNTRMQALAAANTGLAAYNAYNAVNEVANTPNGSSVGGYGVNFSLGHSENQSHSEQQQNNAQGSQVVAGQNLSIFATGNDTADSGNLNVIGSNLSAGNNLALSAVNNILLQAAENQSSQQSRNSSLSASIGMTIGAGQQTGVSFNAGVSGSKGKANGEDISYSNTHVSAGNQVSLNSGEDTTLKGAVVSGQQIVANVGTSGQGNLNIESLQDQSRYTSDQKSGGVSVSVCLPPICGGAPVGGTVNYSKSNINSNFLSVTEQSGFKAGDGGFQIQVNGNTDLIGGLIASNSTAADLGLNQLITETLTSRDLQNQAKYKANSLSISAGIGLNVGPTGLMQNSPSGMAGYGSDSGKANSTTFSAVSAGDLQITNAAAQQAKTGQSAEQTVASLNRDTANTENAIKPIFDQQKVENEINAQTQITQTFSQQAPLAVATFAKTRQEDLLTRANLAAEKGDSTQAQQLSAEAEKWAEGGVYRVAMHTALGGLLTGNVLGAVTGGATAAAAPLLNQLQASVEQALQSAGLGEAAAKLASQGLGQATALGLGAAIGGVPTAAVSFGIDTNNRQLHPAVQAFVLDKDRIERYASLRGITADMAEQELFQMAAVLNDAGWANLYGKSLLDKGVAAPAISFLLTESANLKLPDGSSYFNPSDAAFADSKLFAVDALKGQGYQQYQTHLAISSDPQIRAAQQRYGLVQGVGNYVNHLVESVVSTPENLAALKTAFEAYQKDPEATRQKVQSALSQLPSTVVESLQKTIALANLQEMYGNYAESAAIWTALSLEAVDPVGKMTNTLEISAKIAKATEKSLELSQKTVRFVDVPATELNKLDKVELNSRRINPDMIEANAISIAVDPKMAAKQAELVELEGKGLFNSITGQLREDIVFAYFKNNPDLTPLPGKCGSNNCFDGVFINNKTGEISIVEVKPLKDNGITLNPGTVT